LYPSVIWVCAGEVETTFTVDAPAQVCETNGCHAKVCLRDVMESTLLAQQEDTASLDEAQHCVIREMALLRVDNTLPVGVDLRCHHGGVARGSHHEAKVTGQSSAHVAQPVLYKMTPGQRGPPTADPAGATVLQARSHMTPAMFARYRSALDGRLEDPKVAARSGGEIHYHSPEVYDNESEGWQPDWFLAYLGSEHARVALGGRAPETKVDVLATLDDGDDSATGKHLTFKFKRKDFEQLQAAANKDVVQPMSLAAIPLQDSDLGFTFAPRGRHVAAPVKGTEERPGMANRDAWKAANNSLANLELPANAANSGARALPGECSVLLRARLLYV
jgi:hypothetical protein